MVHQGHYVIGGKKEGSDAIDHEPKHTSSNEFQIFLVLCVLQARIEEPNAIKHDEESHQNDETAHGFVPHSFILSSKFWQSPLPSVCAICTYLHLPPL